MILCNRLFAVILFFLYVLLEVLITFQKQAFCQSSPPSSGLTIWLRADQGVTESAGKVSQWSDQSGNGFHFSQPLATRQPSLVSDTVCSGRSFPAIRFSGTHFLSAGDILDTLFAGPGKQFSFFVVVKPHAVSDLTIVSKFSDGFTGNQARQFILRTGSAAKFQFVYSDNLGTSIAVIESQSSYTSNNFFILSSSYNGAVNSGFLQRVDMTVNLNPQNESLVVGAGPFPFDIQDGVAPLAIGAYVGTAGNPIGDPFNGDIAEVILYNRILTTAELNDALQYLKLKYAPPPVNLGPDINLSTFCPVNLSVPHPDCYLSFQWSTGATTPSISVSSSGSYSVTVTDLMGFSSSDTITVSFPGNINYTGNPLICLGDSATWNTGLSGNYSFLWSNGDTTPSIHITQAGSYSVTVTDSASCSIASQPVTFLIDSFSAKVALDPDDTTLCAGNMIALTKGASLPSSFLWSTNDTSPAIPVFSSGTYALTVSNLNGCSFSDSILVTIAGSAPNAAFSYGSFCFGSPTPFTDISSPPSGSNIVSWKWLFGNGDSSSLQNPSYIFPTTGIFNVSLTVTTDAGCADVASLPVHVINPPVANFSFSTPLQGEPVQFTDLSISDSIIARLWNFDGLASSSAQHPTFTFNNPGPAFVSLIVTDLNNCSDTSIQNIFIIAPPPSQGLTIWLRADQGVSQSAGKVSQWSDQSGNGFHFSQPLAIHQPSLVSDTICSGRSFPAIRFSGTHFLSAGDILDTLFAGPGKQFSFFVVAKPHAVSDLALISKYSDGFTGNQARQFILRTASSAKFQFVYSTNLGTSIAVIESQSSYTSNNFFILSSSYNGAVNSGFLQRVDMTVNLNPQNESLVVGAGPFPFDIQDGVAPLAIGAYVGTAGNPLGNPFNGDIAEVILYNRILNPAELNDALQYLKLKYAPPPVNLGPDINLSTFCPVNLSVPHPDCYLSFQWSTGATTPSISVSNSGSYSVTVTDLMGFSSSDTITVSFPGNINYTGNPLICLGDSATWNTGLSGNYSFLWSNGDTTPSIHITQAGSYSVTVTDSASCSIASQPVTFLIDSFSAKVALDPDDTTLCAGNMIALTKGASLPSSFLWSTNDTSPAIPVFSSGLYALTVSNLNGCSFSDSILVTIAGSAPNAAFSYGSFCFGSPTPFTDISSPPSGSNIVSWKWLFGNGDSSSLQNPSYIFPTTGIFNVSLTVTTDAGCADVASLPVHVINPPVANFSFSTPLQGEPVQFTDLSISDSIIARLWNFDGLASSSAQHPTFTFNNPGPAFVSLIVTDLNNCSDTSIQNIFIIAPPPSQGLTIWLRADQGVSQSAGKVSQWSDQSGNGFHFSQPLAIHQPSLVSDTVCSGRSFPAIRFSGTHFLSAGDILDTLFAGPGKQFSFFVVAKPHAVSDLALISKYSDGFTGNQARQFILRTGSAAKFQFVYSDNLGTSIAVIESQSSYTSNNFFILSSSYNGAVNSGFLQRVDMTVNLNPQNESLVVGAGPFPFDIQDGVAPLAIGAYVGTAGNPLGNPFNGDIAEVILYNRILNPAELNDALQYLKLKYAPPPVNLGPDINLSTFCPVNLSVPHPDCYLSFQWSTGATTPSISVSNSGSYSVTVTDLMGFSSSDTITVSFPGNINYTGNPLICLGDSATWNTGLSGNYSFLWSNGDTTPSIHITQAGSYSVTVTDSASCSIASQPVTFLIDSFSAKVALDPDDTTLCAGNMIALTKGASLPSSFLWSTNDTSPAIPVFSSGTYALTVSNLNGCSFSDSILVTIAGSAPNAAFSYGSFCFGSPTPFTDISSPPPGSNIVSWKWLFGNGDSSSLQNPSYIFPTTGIFNVSLTVTTDAGCADVASLPVHVINPPVANFSFSTPLQGEPVQFTDLSISDSIIARLWNFDGLASSSAQHPTFTFNNPGPAFVSLIVTDLNNCSDTSIQNIFIIAPPPSQGLTIWLRADQGVSQSAGKVSQWSDQSGNGFHFSQPLAIHQPSLVSDTVCSGRSFPAIRFSGTHFLSAGDILDTLFAGPGKQFSFFVVAKPHAVSDLALISKYSDGFTGNQARQFILRTGSAAKFQFVYSNNLGTSIAVIESQSSYTSNNFFILSSSYNGAVNSGFLQRVDMTVNLNPQNESLVVSNGSFPFDIQDGVAPLAIGAYVGTAGNPLGNPFNGDIAEVILYNRILTAAELDGILQYLKLKYTPPPVNLGPDISVHYGFCPVSISASNCYVSYRWNTGDTTAIIYPKSSGTYSVTVTDIFGFTSTDEINVSIPLRPNLNGQFTTCMDVPITFNVNAGQGYNTIWNGNIYSSSFSTTNPGSYFYTVYDTIGCYYSDTVQVVVDSFKNQLSLGPDVRLCSGNYIKPVSGIVPGNSYMYLWSTGSTVDSTVVLSASQNYSLTVINSNGCTATDDIFVTVRGIAPYVDFTFNNICLGDTAFFTDLSVSSDVINFWHWHFGDGNFSFDTNPFHVYQTSNDFLVTLIVGTDSCESRAAKFVPVYPKPAAAFINSIACAGTETVFTDISSIGGASTINGWLWDFGTGNDTSSSKNPEFVFPMPGEYNVTLIVVSNNGCRDTTVKKVEVFKELIADFEWGHTCLGNSTQFYDRTNSFSIVKWNWEFGDRLSGTSSQKNPIYTFPDTGTVTVKLTVENAIGCKSNVEKEVTIYESPEADFNVDATCIGQPTTFKDASNAKGDTIIRYFWNFGDGYPTIKAYNPTYQYADTGTYQVYLRIITESGCQDTIVKTISIVQPPIADFVYYPDFGAAPLNVTFTNLSSTDANSFVWQFGDENATTSDLRHPQHTYLNNETYNVKLIAYNSAGCVDSLTKTIKVARAILDIAVRNINVQQELMNDGNYKVLTVAEINNEGTRNVTSFDITQQIGSQTSVIESWEGSLLVGASTFYRFESSFIKPGEINKSYLCVITSRPNNEPDQNPLNDKLCVALEDKIKVIPPYPSPGSGILNLDIILPRKDQIKILIFDVLGKEIAGMKEEMQKGYNHIEFDRSGLGKGVYAIWIHFGEDRYVEKFVVE